MRQSLSEQAEQVRMLRQQAEEKEQPVQALTAQATEITSSKAWKLVTIIRKIRVWLLPEDSHRERLVKKVWHRMKKLGKRNTL